MGYIFLDESGDLGFDFTKKGTSKFFVITFMFVLDKGPIEKIVKKIFKMFSQLGIKKHSGVLHCYKEKPQIRYKVLSALNQKNVTIISIYLNKSKVYTRLQDEKQVLYNYVTNILLDRICTKKILPLEETMYLIASQRETNKFLNQNFKTYLEGQTRLNHNLKLKVAIKTPHEEKCLQIVDFVCWSIFRRREYGDEGYYNLVKNKIIEENPLFP